MDTKTLQGRRGRCVQPWLRTAVTLRATLLLKLPAVTPSELRNWEATADDSEPASQLCLQGLCGQLPAGLGPAAPLPPTPASRVRTPVSNKSVHAPGLLRYIQRFAQFLPVHTFKRYFLGAGHAGRTATREEDLLLEDVLRTKKPASTPHRADEAAAGEASVCSVSWSDPASCLLAPGGRCLAAAAGANLLWLLVGNASS